MHFKQKTFPFQDKLEDFFVESDIKVYLVSFLDGMQRVVMFTQDLALATVAQQVCFEIIFIRKYCLYRNLLINRISFQLLTLILLLLKLSQILRTVYFQ